MVECRFLQQVHAEARLAAACHAHAHAVGRQVARVVHEQAIQDSAALEVILFAEVERAQRFEIHGESLPAICAWHG